MTTTTITSTSLAFSADIQEMQGSEDGRDKPSQLNEGENVESEYLTHNGSPTGQEPINNPASWPQSHRRVPPYRTPVVNPEWYDIAGDRAMRLFMWTMMSGCQLLQVGNHHTSPIFTRWASVKTGI